MNLLFSKVLFAIWFFATLFGVGVSGEISHAKFIAQQAALSALEGKDPLILRESWLNGQMEPGTAKLVPQQLFKKNSYQFWFAVADSQAEVLLNIYDQEGKLLEAETVRYPPRKNVISLKLIPNATAGYYLRLAVTKESRNTQDWALIYAYK